MRSTLVALALATLAPAQSLLFWHKTRHQLVPVATADAGVDALVRALLASPLDANLTTALPPGTTLVATHTDGRRIDVTLNARFLVARALGTLEDAIEQITKTLNGAGYDHVAISIRTERGTLPLKDALGETPLPPTEPNPRYVIEANATGALSGKTIAISAGHGFYWHSTLGWTTQRGNIGGLIEDIHTNEISMQVLIPMLLNMGARVVACRERGEITREAFADNDQGAPRYSETGTWFTSASSGYGGGGYRYATAALAPTATASWDLVVPIEGDYPVYVFFRAGTNRVADARFGVHHTGGVTTVHVDQTIDDRTWVYLGTFRFTPSQRARVVLDNQSALAGPVVIADAVRIGGGLGSIARGAGTSNKPRWQESSRYWAQFAGAPTTVYDSISGGQDNDDDVTARPRFAEWVGGCDAFVSLHTNAGGGLGTSTYIYNGGATAGSAALQAAVHNRIVADVRANYEPAWTDRGLLSANFGEVRLLSTMPGILVELAFHDVAGSRDHEALRDADFRYIAGRAMARGVLRYFAPTAPFPPEAPVAFRVQQDGTGGLRLAWDAAPGATLYTIEQSPDGKGFVEVAQTAATTWATGALAHDALRSFRVRAANGSGRSMPTDVLSARTSHTKTSECLLVQGFDRLDKVIRQLENTKDYLRLHADALARHGEFSLGFDAATQAAVALGRVPLAPYRVVDWACGEESTEDETFSTQEQTLVAAYLAQGGRMLVTGAEIGWDLEARGSAGDRAFYNGPLGARYVSDDAGTYGFGPTAGGIFAGLASGTFDDGSGPTYDVDYPDTLAAADARSSVCLAYTGGAGAGIQRIDNQSRVVNLGFPLETVLDPNLRAAMAARALRFLLAPRTLEVAATTPVGGASAITLDVPLSSGRPYLLAASLGTAPGLPLDGYTLPLNPDGLFSLSLIAGNGVFAGFFGVLDAQGHGQASVALAPLPVLVGLPLYMSGFVLPDLSGVQVRDMLPWVRTVGR